MDPLTALCLSIPLSIAIVVATRRSQVKRAEQGLPPGVAGAMLDASKAFAAWVELQRPLPPEAIPPAEPDGEEPLRAWILKNHPNMTPEERDDVRLAFRVVHGLEDGDEEWASSMMSSYGIPHVAD